MTNPIAELLTLVESNQHERHAVGVIDRIADEIVAHCLAKFHNGGVYGDPADLAPQEIHDFLSSEVLELLKGRHPAQIRMMITSAVDRAEEKMQARQDADRRDEYDLDDESWSPDAIDDDYLRSKGEDIPRLRELAGMDNVKEEIVHHEVSDLGELQNFIRAAYKADYGFNPHWSREEWNNEEFLNKWLERLTADENNAELDEAADLTQDIIRKLGDKKVTFKSGGVEYPVKRYQVMGPQHDPSLMIELELDDGRKIQRNYGLDQLTGEEKKNTETGAPRFCISLKSLAEDDTEYEYDPLNRNERIPAWKRLGMGEKPGAPSTRSRHTLGDKPGTYLDKEYDHHFGDQVKEEAGGNYEEMNYRKSPADKFAVFDHTFNKIILTTNSSAEAKREAIEWAEYDDIKVSVRNQATGKTMLVVDGYAGAEKYMEESQKTMSAQQRKAHEHNMDAAQREMDRREAEGEDMTGARIDPKTYEIIKSKNPRADKAFGDMFGGGNPVSKLGIREADELDEMLRILNYQRQL